MKNWTSFFRIWAECNNHYTIHQLVPTDGIEPTYRVLQTRANPSQLHWLGSFTVNRTQILRLSVVCSNRLNYGTILLFYYFFTTFYYWNILRKRKTYLDNLFTWNNYEILGRIEFWLFSRFPRTYITYFWKTLLELLRNTLVSTFKYTQLAQCAQCAHEYNSSKHKDSYKHVA